MRRLVSIGIAIILLLVSGSTLALESRKGLELEGRLGPSVCVEHGATECENFSGELKPGFGGGGYLGLRPLSFLSVGLDFGMYSLTVKPNDFDAKLRTTQAMLNLRAYIPFNLIEPFVKLGVGYLSLVVDAEGPGEQRSVDRYYSWGNFKFGGGLTLYLIDSDRIGNIGLGADLDFAMIKPTKAKECLGDSCETEDFSGGSIEIPFAMQFNLHFKWVVPIF